jgi:GAF domain-containing protein
MSDPAAGTEERTGARLEALVAANRAIVAELSLTTLLSLVTESAREVLDAQYAALALIQPDGVVEQVIYSGIDEATLAALEDMALAGPGPLSDLLTKTPGGELGLRVLEHGATMTVVDSGHPLVRSILAVAVQSSSTVYGNLYLGNRLGAPGFTAEDEELVLALAGTAGIAIENARLYEESHRRHQWLQATAEISRRLLAGEDEGTDALAGVAETVQRLAAAELAAVVLPVPATPGELEVVVASGQAADELQGMRYDIKDSVAWQAMSARRGILVGDSLERQGVYGRVRPLLPARQVLAVPLRGEASVLGAIVAIRTNPIPFSPADLQMTEGFANQAALALELADARHDRHRLVLLEDRARIARDLHDHVVQKLFAVGLTLQGAARTIEDPVLQERLSSTVGELDDSIRSIRSAISQLQEPRTALTSARSRVRSVLADLTPSLGFGPIASFDGPLDTVLDESLAAAVETVLRTLLADIAAHAGASSVTVSLSTDGHALTTTVTDDGQAAGWAQRGVDDLRGGIEGRGGRVDLEPTRSGRIVRWTVPLDEPAPEH